MAKKKGFRSYLNDFKLGDDGNYFYGGALYGYYGKKPLKILKAQMLALSILPLLLAVLGGCIPVQGMDNCFYVIIPWLCEVASSVSLVWAAVRLCAAKVPIRGYVFNATVNAFFTRSVLNAVSCVAEIMALTVFVCINGFGQNVFFTILFYFMKIASGFLGFVLAKKTKKAGFKQDKIPQNDIL